MSKEYKKTPNASSEFQARINLTGEHSSNISRNERPRIHNVSFGLDPGTPFEVFRNNTTAIEVIVKEVTKGKENTSKDIPNIAANNLHGGYNGVKKEFNVSNAAEGTQKHYQAIIHELKKQLNTASQKELEAQTKNIVLQIENEKLRSLLTSKSNLLNKLSKELASMKQVTKFIIKSICYPQVSNNITCTTDPEYDAFEKDLQKDVKNNFTMNMFDATGTFDSSVSKEVKHLSNQKAP